MKETLLLLGGGPMQMPVIDWAHKLGLAVVCFDGKADVPGREQADTFVVCDISDKDLCLAKAREVGDTRPVNGVLTVGTDFSTTVAWVAQGLGLPGIPFEVALRAKDKGLMRECFAHAGVGSPQFSVWTRDHAPVIPTFGFPCVVKPADSMGARGVVLVHGDSELPAALDQACRFSPTGRGVVEQYIDGPEFSLDAIVENGVVHRLGLADRHIVFAPHFVEIGHSFPSAADPSDVEALWTEFERGIRAIGITRGAAKGDVKLSRSGPKIGEIAARLSGGYMSGWTYPLSSGRSATLWAIEACLGRSLSPQSPDLFRPVVERAWISLPGIVRQVSGLAAVQALAGVEHVFVGLSAGRRMVFPTNNVEKAGNLVCTGATLEQAEQTARLARNLLKIELEAGNAETNEFLFGASPSPWWFAQAATVPSAQWWAASSRDAWRDPYGNLVRDLLEVEGLIQTDPVFGHSRLLRAFFKGGLQGLGFARESLRE
jgi:biotin carboxylase